MLRYKKHLNEFITALQRKTVYDHMIGYLDSEKIDMRESPIYLLGYLDTPQWVDALKVLEAEYHPALRELAQLVDEEYSTSFLEDIK